MKKFIPVFALSLLSSLFSFAETDLPHITVYGTAEEMVVPDELNWSVSVKTVGASIEEVATNHLKDVSNVLGYLKSLMPEKEIKTSRMQLNETWVYRDKSQVREGYYAFTAIRFISTDFSKYTDCWKQLSKFNNLRINQVSFDFSNRIEIRNRVRLEAVKSAKEKAKTLAESLGVSLMEPLVVEEIPGDDADIRMQLKVASGFDRLAREPASISPGEQSITSRVKLIFRITAK